ncbi:hypothetical protein PLESTB_001343400 [Pleodorina starrii]|uniref:Coenzyme Q-binding protein COQ10 START domain-containing protein n=1 Tax=Pleodorina starrii TaxID=330485 RepID=A0A9W6BUA8_9CHLO|nr:hypothetical protein PLESTM_001455700 [Pleodorina starrii]GLC58298.1 hypothetical protein PLESTB_001343400 [Pleodorina starrii]GLC66350.1 hypothetical protein PLESTF_000414900 [Pleodorina starrii]
MTNQGQGVAKGGAQTSMDNTEAWEEKGQTISVSEGGGFLYNITLRAKVDSNPNDIYDILTDPNTNSIFRSIKECTYRRVLEDDGRGRRKLEVGHRAITRFLFISVSFETHLHVWEDDNERTIKFQMARPGMMQKFDGCWRIKPFTQETLDSIYHPERLQGRPPHHHHHHQHQHHQQQHHGGGFGPFNASGLFGFLSAHKPHPEASESLVTLEQNILPRGHVPPGVKGLVRGLCAHQIRCLMDDLRIELQRRKDGTSSTLGRKPMGASAPGGTHAAEQPAAEDKGKGRAAAATAATSLALAGRSLWSSAAPFNITVQL